MQAANTRPGEYLPCTFLSVCFCPALFSLLFPLSLLSRCTPYTGGFLRALNGVALARLLETLPFIDPSQHLSASGPYLGIHVRFARFLQLLQMLYLSGLTHLFPPTASTLQFPPPPRSPRVCIQVLCVKWTQDRL